MTSNFSNEWVRYQICNSAQDVCTFIQGKININIISITQFNNSYTIFYY